jgi:hypothetical protein
VCIEGVTLSWRLRRTDDEIDCSFVARGGAGEAKGGVMETPESFLVCLGGVMGSGGVGGTSGTVTDTVDFDEDDLRGLGRTMASCGDEALFRWTFRTIG